MKLFHKGAEIFGGQQRPDAHIQPPAFDDVGVADLHVRH